LQTILDYLNKKWLSNFNEQFTIDLFPDEKKWLTEVAFHSKPNSNSLGGNFMLHDLVLAYNFPTDDVIYLFYELKNVKNNKILKQNNFKNDKNIGNVNDFNEKNSNPFENIDYFESKRKAFSNLSERSQRESFDNNNPNSQNNKSLSLFSFYQRMPFKHTENFHSPFSNLKNLNLNEKSCNNFNENSELSRFLKKNSENGENFPGPGFSQFFDKEITKNNNSLMNLNDFKLKTSNSFDEPGKLRKSQQHFQKISDIIDIFSKNQETSFSNFKENYINKKKN